MKTILIAKKGFTLVELMIVVAIIGILAAIAIPNFVGLQEKTKKKTMMEVVSSAKPELHSWMSSYVKDEKGVIDVDSSGTITSVDDPGGPGAPGNLVVMVSTWIASVYAQKGTQYSPWYPGRGLFTSSAVAQSGQIVLSMIASQQKIVIRALGKNGELIITDNIALE